MISIQEAYQLAQNDIRFRVKLTLYNGEEIYCIPTIFHQHTDLLHVTKLNSKTEIEVRRETINSWEQLAVYSSNDIFPLQAPTYSGQFAKKLIIIGAGASHGYSNVQRTPLMPLANQIFQSDFDDILNGFQGAKNFATSSAYATDDLEAYFQKQWDRIKRYDVYDPVTVSFLISMQYYLSSLFLHLSKTHKGYRHNLYNHLVQMINSYLSDKSNNEKVLIVSFNYDTLIEEAISSVMLQQFETTDNYVDYQRNKLLLFKPHGSCNWFRKSGLLRDNSRELTEAISNCAQKLFSKKTNLGELRNSLNDEVDIIDQIRHDTGNKEFGHFPQLLIPFKDKDDFAMPSKHLEILNQMMSKVDDVLIIGWKGSEEKFKDTLKANLDSRPIKIHYSNYKDESIETEYKKLLPSAKIQNVKRLFETAKSDLFHSATPDFAYLIRYLETENNFFFG